jgi:hypothetical protein
VFAMALTAEPEQSEPQRATMVLSTTTGVASSMSPTYLTGMASSSTSVDLGSSSASSMISPPIFHGKWENLLYILREKERLTDK